ncbi:tail fiber protein [Xenorhabdus sp. SGI246]|uniref:tail fiber protein n=1 Tax=Xenorhabdus sp. SGI246 TaxID=3158263 RepID=UPI00349F1039
MQDKELETQVLKDKGLVIVPTPEYVKETIEEHALSRNHPDATLQDKGFVILSNDVSSDSETMAATPKAVKAAYDLANNANNNANIRLSKDLNGADIPDKAEFVKNLGLSDTVKRVERAIFVVERGQNASGSWVIWSDGAIELFGRGISIAGLATVRFPIELPRTSHDISIAEHIARDPESKNVGHVSMVIDETVTRLGFQARCQYFNGNASTNSFTWRLYCAPI